MTYLGVDIGGTKIRITVFDTEMVAGRSVSIPTAALRRGTREFAYDLVGLLRAHRAQDHMAIGLVLNGVLNDGHVEYSSLMGGAVDFSLRTYLSEQIGRPVYVDDDIHAMGIAEYHYGLGQGHDSFAMLNLGTGIGVACVENGTVLRGMFAAGLMSEQLVWVEQLGGWRSLDRTVCGRGLKEMYAELTGRAVESVTVMRLYKDGDAAAATVVEAFSDSLVWTLQLISRMYHPEAISLNGSVAAVWEQLGTDILSRYRAGLEDVFHAESIAQSVVTFPAERGVLRQVQIK